MTWSYRDTSSSVRDMYAYMVFGLSCLCTCVHAETCSQAVFAKRETFEVPLGGNKLFACVVQHCGEKDWAWSWTWLPIRGNMSTVVSTVRHILTNTTLSANQSNLLFQIQGFKQEDAGDYGCQVTWESGRNDKGHMSSVDLLERSVLPKLVVIIPASLGGLLALVLLACCASGLKGRRATPGGSLHTSQHNPVPPSLPIPLPRKNKSRIRKASSKPKVQRQPTAELIYADIVHDASGNHEQAVKESRQDTVYCSIWPGGGACDA